MKPLLRVPAASAAIPAPGACGSGPPSAETELELQPAQGGAAIVPAETAKALILPGFNEY